MHHCTMLFKSRKYFQKIFPCSVFVILGCINKAEDNKRKTFRFVLNNAVEFVVCPCLQGVDKNTSGVKFFFHVDAVHPSVDFQYCQWVEVNGSKQT